MNINEYLLLSMSFQVPVKCVIYLLSTHALNLYTVKVPNLGQFYTLNLNNDIGYFYILLTIIFNRTIFNLV